MPLENPTVADIVDFLLDLPPDAPFKVDVAVLACKGDVLNINVDERGCVWLSGATLQ
jgi:hypothetical protein